ncbi:MAG: PAS domain-containing protein [Anaerolineaceae bacterium]|nr:PAS domain-containing protein [Anaerolineaceae bacterium]
MLPTSLFNKHDIDDNRILSVFLEFDSEWETLTCSDGSSAYLSPNCSNYFGATPEKIFLNSCLPLNRIPSKDREYLDQHSSLETDKVITTAVELSMISASGETLFFEHICTPVFNRQGKYLGRWGRNRLIGEKDLTRNQNWFTPEILHSVIGQAPDNIIIIDTLGKILFNSRSLLSDDVDDAIGKSAFDYIIPEQRALAYETIQRVIATGQPDMYEISADIEGRRLRYMTRVGLVKEDNHISFVTLMIRDITDRKAIEQELKQLNDELELRVDERTLALKDSLERHQVISELIPDYVYSACLQPGGRIHFDWISGALEQITGYNVNEINLMKHGWLSIIHPEDEEKVINHIRSISQVHNTVFDYRFIHRSGGIRWMKDTIKQIEGSSADQGVSFWGAAEDITEHVLSEVALQRHTWRLEASERLNFQLRQVENRQQALETLINGSNNAMYADSSGIYLLLENNLTLAITNNAEISNPPDSFSLIESRLLHNLMNSPKQTIFLTLTDRDYSECMFCEYLRRTEFKAVAIAPLRTTHTIIGFLFLAYRQLPGFSSDDRQLLGAMAESGGNTLHRILIMEELERHIASREKELNVLHEIMTIAAHTLDLNQVLHQSLTIVLEATGVTCGMIHLNNPGINSMKLMATCNVSAEMSDRLNVLLTQKLYLNTVSRGKTLNQIESHPYQIPGKDYSNLAYLGVPMRTRGQIMGVVSLFGFLETNSTSRAEAEAPFSQQVTGMTQIVADQLAAAVESARLSQKTQETLIIEERQRLARNLHDSVTQFLYGLVLNADIGAKYLARQNLENLEETLDEIGDSALQALREMRLLLFELKPHALAEEGLVKALELRLDAVERRAGIESSFEVSGEEHLPSQLESEIYRLTTEALNNSLKHAAAESVCIRLNVTPDLLLLEVSDNGKGFNINLSDTGGIGLASMRERSLLIGGDLNIQSVPGEGTCIVLSVKNPVKHRKDGIL